MKNVRIIFGIVLLCVYALSFFVPSTVFAAEQQRCKLGENCTVGEYLYDDEYAPITDATCTLASRNPDGTVYLNDVAMTSAAENDGWYSHTFDTTGKTEGIYRTQMCCTSGGEYMCLDKTFAIGASYLSTTDVSSAVWDSQTSSHSAVGTFGNNLQTAAPSASDIWSYSGRSLTSFGTLIADMWSYSSRSLTSFGTLVADVWSNATRTLTGATLSDGGQLATNSDIQTATDSAVTSIKGSSNKDLTQVSTQVAGVQTTADAINTKVDTLTTNLATINTNVNTLVSKWGSYSASDIITNITSVQTALGTTSDTCSSTTIFGYIQCVRDKWGAQTASSIYTAANNAATTAAELQDELDYNGKSTTAYEDAQTLLANLSSASTAITSANTAIAAVQTKVNTIDTKIDSLTTQVSSLSTSVSTINTNVNTLVSKWSTYSMTDVISRLSDLQTDLGATSNTCSDDTVFGYIQCIQDKWGSQTAAAIYTAANNAATTATELQAELDYNGKSTTAYDDIQDIQGSVADMQALIGATGDASSTSTLFGRIKKVQETVDTLDTSGADLSELMDKWGDYSAGDIYDKVKDLSEDIADVNAVSNVSSILTLSQEAKIDLTTLKNSILSLSALTEVNKTLLLEGTSKPIIKTWLEEGSIIFKSLITNPTLVSQTVPFKFYLPKEASKRDIEKIDDGLIVGYDPTNDATYVTGQFNLKPHETKITYVEVKDIWKISDREIQSIKLQNEKLFEPLKNTALFAQGATISSDVVASLDNVVRLQHGAHTPEERIEAYREAIIDFNRAKSGVENLKTLLATAGSTQTLVGFVGGVQTLAVWGLIVVLIAGFVFLALYMRYITEQRLNPGKHSTSARAATKKNFHFNSFMKKVFDHKVIAFSVALLISMGVILMFKNPILTHFQSTNSYISPVPLPSVTPQKAKVKKQPDEVSVSDEKQVLGTTTNDSEVVILVDTTGINVREAPSTDSKVITLLKKTTSAQQINKADDWIQISFRKDADSEVIKGWVKQEFVKVNSQ